MPNTSELLSEPETPVNTVSRRFGISMLTSLRLFTRAPCTRIRSWRSATSSAGDFVSVLVALLIVSPSVGRGRLRCLLGGAWIDLTSFEQYVWFYFLGAVAATVCCLPDRRCRPGWRDARPADAGRGRARRQDQGIHAASARGASGPATRRARRGVRPTSGRRASARGRAARSPRARQIGRASC